MKIKFNNNHLRLNGIYYELGLSLLQEGNTKTMTGDHTTFNITDNTRFQVTDIIGFENNGLTVTEYPTFIYSDNTILDDEVYPELPNNTITEYDEEGEMISERALLFSEWTGNGNNPIYTSSDGLKVILRTNIEGYDLTGTIIKKLSERQNIEVLGQKELLDKLNTIEFDTEAEANVFTVSSINDNWITDFNDFKQAREKMKEIVSETGFQNLTHSEKKISARWFAVPITEIDSVLSFSEKLEASEFFNTMSIRSREKRLGACMLLGRNVLSFEDSNMILDDILKYGFINSYVTIGREGTEQMNVEGVTDPDGIIDYLKAKEGTIYEHTGLLTKDIVPINGMTLEQLSDTFVGILLRGS